MAAAIDQAGNLKIPAHSEFSSQRKTNNTQDAYLFVKLENSRGKTAHVQVDSMSTETMDMGAAVGEVKCMKKQDFFITKMGSEAA